MRPFSLVRAGFVFGLGAAWLGVACGSDDGGKKARNYDAGAGEAGNDASAGGSSSGSDGDGGDPGRAGAPGLGVAGTSEVGGEAGTTSSAGASGADPNGGAAGATDPGPSECPVGSADCDDNHDDCETNTASDALNCGRCERVCGASATCTTGLCGGTEILNPSGSANYCDAAFSPTTAYMLTCWGSFTEIRVTPLVPGANLLGTQIESYSVPVTAARGMLIDGNDVLFGIEESPSHLYKFPLDADGPEDVSIAYTFENAVRFDSIQLVGDTFYWNHNTHTAAGQIKPGLIQKRAKTGASSVTLVDGLGVNYDLQVFPSQLVWLEQRTTNDVTSVYRAPIAGALVADVELVAQAAPGAYMTRRGDYVYWTTKLGGTDGRLSRLLADDASAKREDIATGLTLPEGIVTDEEYAYFKQADALYRVPLAGGEPEQLSPTIAANDSQATQIYYVDDKYVYFAAGSSAGSSTVVRVAK